MSAINQILLILHFLGLTMGFSVTCAGLVMSGLMAKAAPSEKAVLGRFPPLMMRVGDIGLVLLWITGVALVYNKWGGFAILPWQFHAKLTAVVLLTVTMGYIHRLQSLIRKGDPAAAARIETVGQIASAFALVAVVFAVLTFD